MNFQRRVKGAWDGFRGKSIPDIYNIRGFGRYSVGLNANDPAELLKAYKSWVYACVDQRAKSTAAALFRAYLKRGADEWTEIEGHQVLDLISQPNPYSTQFEFLYRTVTHLDLVGDAYWYIARNGLGVPAELWLLPVDRMEVVPHATEFISHYELSWPDRASVRFGVGEVIHLKYPSPSDPYYGISPLSAAAASYNIDEHQHEYQDSFYGNSAIPAIALSTDKALGDVARKKLKDAWQEGFGGKDNVGKTPVLDNGLKVEKIGISPKELDWLATNRATRDDILAIFGVPASKLGLVEDVNRSSAVANDYTFAKNTIEPILQLIDQKLTLNLARGFDERLYIKHDSTIPKDEEARARIMQMRLGAGMTTRNEERLQDGFDAIDGGDTLLVPVNYQSLDRALAVPVVEGESAANS